MARSQKRRVGIGYLNPDPEDSKDICVSATATPAGISYSYRMHNPRDQKRPRTQAPDHPLPDVAREPATKPQPRKCKQVWCLESCQRPQAY